MKRTKKIYRWVNRLVDACKWCDGHGSVMGSWHYEKCSMCKGQGGRRKRVRELVGEEIIQ